MKNFLKRYWLVIVLSFLAAALFVFRANNSRSIPPLASISPPPGSRVKPGEEIKIVFARPIASVADKISLKTTPELDFKKETQETTLKLVPRHLPAANRYFFELRFAGRPLYSWSYFPANPPRSVSPSALPLTPTVSQSQKPASGSAQEIGNKETVREVAKETKAGFPLIKYVPYDGEDFFLNYISPLKLGVEIKAADKEAAKKKVFDWIRSKGVDPKTHEIVWF